MDLTSFNIHFLRESLESISNFNEVTMETHYYIVKVVVNYSYPYNPYIDHSSLDSSDQGDLGDSSGSFGLAHHIVTLVRTLTIIWATLKVVALLLVKSLIATLSLIDMVHFSYLAITLP